jgi:hypothetical protein
MHTALPTHTRAAIVQAYALLGRQGHQCWRRTRSPVGGVLAVLVAAVQRLAARSYRNHTHPHLQQS